MISANAYHSTYKLKGAQIFAVFMKDLELLAVKKAKPETD